MKAEDVAFFVERSPDEIVAKMLIEQWIEDDEIADINDARKIHESRTRCVMQDLKNISFTFQIKFGFCKLKLKLTSPK